jgi:hypothetical protein
MRQWSATSKKIEWLVRAPQGAALNLTASAQRAGVATAGVTL